MRRQTGAEGGPVESSPRLRGHTLMSALTVGVTALGCSGDAGGGRAWAGTVETLPSGAVHVVSPDEGLWPEGSEWRLEEDLRIGSFQTEGPDLFGQIADVTIDSAQRILVLEQQSNELRVFTSEGSHVRTIGREGAGPGELRLTAAARVFIEPSGRIWIANSGNQRWDLFSPEGDPLATTPSGPFLGRTFMGRDGTFYQWTVELNADGGVSRRVVSHMEIQGDSLVLIDTFDTPEISDGEVVRVSLSVGERTVQGRVPLPLTHRPSWRLDPSGHFWVDRGDGYRLLALSPEHDTIRIIERSYDPVPITSGEVDEAMEQFETGRFAGGAANMVRSRIPDHHAAINRFMTDELGNLWVRRVLGADLIAWEVFDADGRFLGAVQSDIDLSRLTVHVITPDRVYGVFRDDLDVQYVVRLRILKSD